MRQSKIERKTFETDINLELNIDGNGESKVETGIGFFDHMLTLFSKHGGMDLNLLCKGDLEVDCHHSVEDVGIVLGQAFAKCIEDKKGLKRYESFHTPMDEALILSAVDISGRPYLVFNAEFSQKTIGNFDTEMVEEFFKAFVNYAKITLHINVLYGQNTHHIIEGVFKSVGRTLASASRVVGDTVMSTKGVIE